MRRCAWGTVLDLKKELRARSVDLGDRPYAPYAAENIGVGISILWSDPFGAVRRISVPKVGFRLDHTVLKRISQDDNIGEL